MEKINDNGRLSPNGPREKLPVEIRGPDLYPSPAHDCYVNLNKSLYQLKLSFNLSSEEIRLEFIFAAICESETPPRFRGKLQTFFPEEVQI